MSKQLVNRNNVVAGLFFVGSVVLATGMSFLLTDVTGKFSKKKDYIFRFTTEVGVTGLEPGAEVTFGGLHAGTVKSISAEKVVSPGSGVEIVVAHDVHVALDADLVLHEDAYADLSPPILGGVSTINIPSAGTGSYEGGPPDANLILDPGEVMRGRFAPSILAQLGFTTEQAEKIKASIDDVKAITSDARASTQSVRRMTDSLEPEFISGVDDGKSTIANVRAFTERLNGEDGWSGRVDGILVKAEGASAKLEPTIDDARATIADARSVITEGKPKVMDILDHVEATTKRVKLESLDQIDALLDKGSLALGSYKDLADDAREMVSVNRPKIDSTMDSARDIGINSKLMIEELRAQPWRLLKKPSKEDLAREPIYEAAREYAQAVSDLRHASEALDAAVALVAQNEGTGEPGVSVADLARISKVVEEAYGRYELAENGLLEKLRGSIPNQP
ncbi:MAG: MlaD family protein [Phycisphaerales bacterium]